ncbi:CLASP N terminal, putative [Angomonas deanei]|uniref:CLASP N terminal, putative n=1 Tax=Angomonas deanei TaxID=59799 RepID=A0A7G2CBN1_9TRYP|nr:CLASP N terminal, putative [Angomonas deanei]
MPPKKAGKEESFLKVCKRIKAVLLTEKDSSLSKDNAASYVQQKIESLKLLCDCIQEGGANREAFLEGMQLLRTSIRLQLEDASLLIVNAACHVVSAILLKCDAGSPEETILNWFVPQLFLLTSHSSTAVSTTATEVLLTMGRKGLINAESLSEVLRRCLSKNKTHRWTSYMVLLTVLLNYPATSKGPLLAHFNGPVCKLITAGLHDPNEDVRRVSKRCFSAFTAFQPDGSLVDTMLSGLDAKTVQSLLEEEDVDAYTVNRVAEQTGGASLFGNMPAAVPLHQRAKSGVAPRSSYTVAALNDELRQVASLVNRTSKHPVTAKPSQFSLCGSRQRSLFPCFAPYQRFD